jgi:hypothetical protein
MFCDIPDEGTYTHFPHCMLCLVYTVKYKRWNRFFKIFSVDMWICNDLLLVLDVITVSCISNYQHKIHLHNSSSYSNIFSVTSNIISAVLPVSANTQSRSAPLHMFLYCWVCYSVANTKCSGRTSPHTLSNLDTRKQSKLRNKYTYYHLIWCFVSCRYEILLTDTPDTTDYYSQKCGMLPYLRLSNRELTTTTITSWYILSHLWIYEGSNAIVIFLMSKKHEGSILTKHNRFSTRHILVTANLVSLSEYREMQSSGRHCTCEGVHMAKF